METCYSELSLYLSVRSVNRLYDIGITTKEDCIKALKSGDLTSDGFYKGNKVRSLGRKSMREISSVFEIPLDPLPPVKRDYREQRKKSLSIQLPLVIEVVNGKTLEEMGNQINRSPVRMTQIVHNVFRKTIQMLNQEGYDFSYKDYQYLTKIRKHKEFWLNALKKLADKHDIKL